MKLNHRPTRRQMMTLKAMDRYFAEWGIMPTMAELGRELGISRPVVHEHMSIMVDKGLLTNPFPGQSRAYDFTALSAKVLNHTPSQSGKF